MKNISRRAWARLLLFLVFPGSLAFLSVSSADDRARGLAIVAGSVFDSNGRSLPGCKVVVTREPDSKTKKQALTDRRGEFAVRVPPGKYMISVEAKGFATLQKTVQVEEAERSNSTFLLAAE